MRVVMRAPWWSVAIAMVAGWLMVSSPGATAPAAGPPEVDAAEGVGDDDEAMEEPIDGPVTDDVFADPEGSLRFIPRGFTPPVPEGMFGGLGFGGPDGTDDVDIAARERTVEYWATLILDRVGRLDDAEAHRAALTIAGQCMRSIALAETVRVEEGVARGVAPDEIERLADAKSVRSRGGFWYHAEATACDPVTAARLTAMVVDPSNLAGPGGGKFCGGFHPDLRLDYGPVEVLVCLGCRDIRYVRGAASVTFDLTEGALAEFETIGGSVFRHHEGRVPRHARPARPSDE